MIRPLILILAPLCVASAAHYQLKPTPKTVAWGHYDATTTPVLHIRSGDTVEVQTLTTASPTLLEGAGLLPQDFPYSKTKLVRLDEKRGVARFSAGIEIPLRPFFGSMGVAPAEIVGRISSAPPWVHAGNMDN